MIYIFFIIMIYIMISQNKYLRIVLFLVDKNMNGAIILSVTISSNTQSLIRISFIKFC
jgi:hypothetical protein